MTKPPTVTTEHLNYLDELYERDIFNAFAAWPWLRDEYRELSAPQAQETVTYWSTTYSQRKRRHHARV